MIITRFLPTLMTLTILMTSAVAASTINGINDHLTSQNADNVSFSQYTIGIQAKGVNEVQNTIFALPLCNPNSSGLTILAEPYLLACYYFSPVVSHNKQAFVAEFQISPDLGKSVTFKGWPAWIRDGNAPPPGHYDTDSADNRHVRVEFRFGFYVNQNGRLQLQLND
ncbi:MAG: hypothetical protein GYB58_15920 [Gammaproteobacteria bacterium]|nr:hypothetical protein [Gammaproteobacteria bacterium]